MNIKVFLIILISVLSISVLSGQKKNKKIEVTGYVTDSLKNPIAGGMIFIDDKNTNLVTDNKGYYKVRVRSDADTITVFTYFNGVSETAINGRDNINFTLAPAASSHQKNQYKSTNNEAANLGYGNTDQKNNTSTVSKKDTKINKYAAYQTIYELLKEHPGVTVNGTMVRIRGSASLNSNNDPLYIVDGIAVRSIDAISPQMVENISILKGAATSIYGSRGTNGVILINLIK